MPKTIQRSFTKGELSPSLHTRADLRLYATGLSTCKNFFIHPEGGATTRPGFAWVGQVKGNAGTVRLIPFAFSVEQTYVLEFTDYAMRVIKDGGYVTDTSTAISAISLGATTTITASGHGLSNGDEVFIDGIVGTVELNNGWYTVANATVNTFDLQGVDSTGYTAYVSGGTVARLYTVASPYAAADLAAIKYTQSADVMTLVHPSYDVRELTRTGHTSWTFSIVSYVSTVSAPTGLAVTAGGSGCSSYNKTYEYVVTAVDNDGKESLPSSSASITTPALSATCYNALSWTAVTGAASYNIYKAASDSSGVYGWIGTSSTTSYRDYNIAPDMADAPPEDRQPFNGANNKPSTVNYYQQRILFAASNNDPQTVWASQSGNYHSMRVSSPSKDDDAITFTIASQKVNKIRHLVALDALIILTSGGEWKVTEGQDEVLTPSTVGVRPQSYYGASDVQPAVVGNTAVYVQEKGTRVRDIAYTFEVDAYTGSDLSILAHHLFDGYTINEMAYAQEPYSQLFALRDDGVLLGCTYHKEHQVNAWYRYEIPGATIKSIAVVSEGDQDVLYAAVESTVNLATRRDVLRLHPVDWTRAEDAFCVDFGATYSGAATQQIAGLRHLEGETVVALADGNVVNDLTVTNGVVTLPYAAGKVHIGKAYECDLGTLPIDFTQDLVVRGEKKNVAAVALRFLNSRAGWIGTDASNLVELKSRTDADGYDTIALRTYEQRFVLPPGWTQDGQILIRQRDPLPMTILAIVPEVSIG